MNHDVVIRKYYYTSPVFANLKTRNDIPPYRFSSYVIEEHEPGLYAHRVELPLLREIKWFPFLKHSTPDLVEPGQLRIVHLEKCLCSKRKLFYSPIYPPLYLLEDENIIKDKETLKELRDMYYDSLVEQLDNVNVNNGVDDIISSRTGTTFQR
jgi:hypothetical protein